MKRLSIVASIPDNATARAYADVRRYAEIPLELHRHDPYLVQPVGPNRSVRIAAAG